MNQNKISVLYIDDEANNLNIFKATFRFDFDIHLANSALEAFDILKQHPVQVIIADQRMPDMTGVEFFEAVIEIHKDPVRMLLTAHADIEAAIDSINKGQVYRYIKKPWDEDELKIAIINAYEIFNTRRKLHVKNRELQKTNEELNRFVYSASHDLKAPLLSIKGLLDVARLEGSTKDPEKYFGMITNSVRQLEVFIENIINYYKNVRLDDHFTEINFSKIIQETIDSYQFYNGASAINFNVVVDEHEKFICDEFRIRVIFNNLLSNAIKYQKANEEKKSVSIRVKIVEGNATLVLEDNGIGIAKQYINDIYKMFYRATRENSGSGIGLYIVKEAVTKIRGEIHVTSQEGIGTKFIIHIPNKINIS